MSRVILPTRNKLIYPGGNPGFDPSHIASNGVSPKKGFSGIAANGGFISLLNASKATLAGSPVSTINSNIGPSTALGLAGADTMSFTGQSTVAATSYTFGGIFWINTLNTGSNANQLFTNNDNFNTATLNSAGGFLSCQVNNTSLTSTIAPAANTPYFFIISCPAARPVNFLLLNLRTSQIQTATVANSASAAAPSGTYWIGGSNTFEGTGGAIAAMMYSTKALSLPQMRQWAQDPWGFWYPNSLDLTQMLSAAAPAGGSTGSSSGTATATGVALSTAASVGTSSGSGAATGIALSTATSVGTSSGAGTATGVAISTATSIGTSSGIGVALAVGQSIGAGSVGTIVGQGTATGVSASIAASVGTSSGQGTATAVATAILSSVGTSSGQGSVVGVSASIAVSVGTSAGIGTAFAVGTTIASGSIGIVNGFATVLGLSTSIASAVGTCSGQGNLSGITDNISIFGGMRWNEGLQKQAEHRKHHSDAIKHAAQVISKLGGHARAESLTAKQRSNIASTAAKARWK